ncbi:MAG: tyrosine-type recombinase/integrase [Candidatus Polarisedimenticolia bacterium]
MSRLDPLIEGYLSYLADVGRKAPRTVIDVRCTLGRLVRALAEICPGVSPWHATLEHYLAWLEQGRQAGHTSTSLAKRLSHARGLLDYAWRSGRAQRNVLDGFQLRDAKPRGAPRALTLEEAHGLILACPRATPLQRRDRLMILLLYGCGLRTQELCALDVGDVNRERRELQVLKAKGDRPRVVPIPDGVYTELLAYLLERGGKRGALFRTATRRRRLSSKDAGAVVRDAARRAGVAGDVTPRTLRHTFATHLMDRGVDVAVISSLMGHRSPQETGVYLHVLPQRPEAAVRALDGGPRP